eukprot:gb/GEZN01007542.1/.p1 GENE.gb/GEZN01007542.1/~~gb/GEZN01007542.1/.p1  ORF type:complete len:255 (+),score=19.56 gb/GEZN01007542.1/:517-1281(+)
MDPVIFGYPFRWAQSLCGIFLIHPRIPNYPQPSLNIVLERLARRYHTRLSLHKQYGLLVKRQYPFSAETDFFPSKSKAYLNSWKAIKPEKWPGRAEETSTYFEAVFSRSQVELQAFVEVPSDYPQHAPVFHLKFLKDLTKPLLSNELLEATADPEVLKQVLAARTNGASLYNNDLQAMEIEVNETFPTLLNQRNTISGDLLLSYQVRKLQALLDVYLEMNSGKAQGKFYARAVRGRTRRAPYTWNSEEQMYDQQ